MKILEKTFRDNIIINIPNEIKNNNYPTLKEAWDLITEDFFLPFKTIEDKEKKDNQEKLYVMGFPNEDKSSINIKIGHSKQPFERLNVIDQGGYIGIKVLFDYTVSNKYKIKSFEDECRDFICNEVTEIKSSYDKSLIKLTRSTEKEWVYLAHTTSCLRNLHGYLNYKGCFLNQRDFFSKNQVDETISIMRLLYKLGYSYDQFKDIRENNFVLYKVFIQFFYDYIKQNLRSKQSPGKLKIVDSKIIKFNSTLKKIKNHLK